MVFKYLKRHVMFQAGTFLCNQTMYKSLHYGSVHNPSLQAGFIHIPPLPSQVVQHQLTVTQGSMSLDTLVKAVEAAIEALDV